MRTHNRYLVPGTLIRSYFMLYMFMLSPLARLSHVRQLGSLKLSAGEQRLKNSILSYLTRGGNLIRPKMQRPESENLTVTRTACSRTITPGVSPHAHNV